jgi:hypothetical protein
LAAIANTFYSAHEFEVDIFSLAVTVKVTNFVFKIDTALITCSNHKKIEMFF